MWSLTPYFQRNTPPSLVIAFVFLWFAIFVLGSNIMRTRVNIVYLLAISWIVVLILQYLRVSDITSTGNLLSAVLFFFPMFLFMNLKINYSGNAQYAKGLFSLILVVVCLTIISNLLILIEDPTASKYLTGSIEQAVQAYTNTNLAALPHVTVIALLLPVYLFSYKRTNGFTRLFFLFLTLSCVVFVYFAGASITLMAMILALSLIPLLRIERGYPKILASCLVISIFSVFMLLIDPIGTYLYEISYGMSNQFYATRLQELAFFMRGISSDGSLTARMDDIVLSLNSFLSSPLFGKGLIYHSDLYLTGIGMHSQIIDDLARHGLIGSSILCAIYFKWYKSYYMMAKNRELKIVVISMTCSILFVALFNMFSNHLYGLMIFLIIPVFIEVYRSSSSLGDQSDR
jgi:hypothetical protein